MRSKINFLVAALLLISALAAPARSVEPLERQSEIIERLYLNHRQLTGVYRDLHDAALGAVDGSERQLGYIQKTYLFVSEANLIAFYQWELLAAIDYIKDSHLSDYLTLRVKDLDRAIFESRDRVRSLKLYQAFIAGEELHHLVSHAIGLIEANIYMFEELRELFKPRANPPNAFERLPDGP
jgi:hypothetical protein